MLGTRMAKVASWIWCGPRRFHGWSPLESHLCHKVPQSAACDDGTSTSLQVTKRGVCEGDKSKISWTQDLLSTMNCRLLLCFLFAFASFCTLFALQVVAWQQSYSSTTAYFAALLTRLKLAQQLPGSTRHACWRRRKPPCSVQCSLPASDPLGLARFDESQPGQRIHWRVLLRGFDQ